MGNPVEGDWFDQRFGIDPTSLGVSDVVRRALDARPHELRDPDWRPRSLVKSRGAFDADVARYRDMVRERNYELLLEGKEPIITCPDDRTTVFDMTGGCPAPFPRKSGGVEGAVWARAMAHSDYLRIEDADVVCVLLLPCKKRSCTVCADSLVRRWCARAAAEFDKAERTWLCTLTLSPEEHLALAMAVRLRHGLNISDRKYRQLRASELGRMVYAWLRRVTGKEVAANVRYFAVIEPHDSEKTSVSMRGNPHVHLLVHERFVGSVVMPMLVEPLRKGFQGPPARLFPRTESGEWNDEVDRNGEVHARYRLRDEVPLRREWHFGHSRITLCLDKGAAMEVAKYLRKDPYGRTKCSQHYGAEAAGADPPVE